MRPILFLWLALFSLFSLWQPALAKNSKIGDVIFEADKVARNNQKNFVEAIGSVQLDGGDYLLIADRVRYFEEKKIVSAFGKVILVDPNGDFIFAQKAIMFGDWQTGNLENAAVLFKDGSKLTARTVKRDLSPSGSGYRKQMQQASYSPCKVCRDKKNYPLWQISASKVIHYEESKTIYYNNLFLEFFGLKVLYFPFFAHPDPSIKRRTGFLTPSVAYSSRLGFETKTPFTIDFLPQTSLILTPAFTSLKGIKFQTDWKHWTSLGKYNLSFSAVNDPSGTIDGHLFSSGDFDLKNNVRINYNGELASDDDYLELFGITRKKKLNSNLNFTWNNKNISLSIKNNYIKTIIKGSSDQPDLVILPDIKLSSNVDFLGGSAFTNTSLLFLLRPKKQITNISDRRKFEEKRIRLSGELGWQDEWIVLNSVFKLYGSARYDFYQRQNFYEENSNNKTKKQNFKRILPITMLEWRFPLIRNSSTQITQLIEPTVQLIYAPYRARKNQPPNEDSRNFNFTYNNLLKINRFNGFDRWESGPRANVSLKWSLYNTENFSTSLALGKIFRLRESSDFNNDDEVDISGAGAKDSDIVAAWNMSSSYLSFSQSARFDRKQVKLMQYDGDASLVFSGLSFSFSYTLNQEPGSDRNTTNSEKKLQEIYSKLTIPLSKYWEFWGGTRYDLSGSNILHYEGGLRYDDECFGMDINFSQYKNQVPSSNNELRVGLRLVFTNLGNLNFNAK